MSTDGAENAPEIGSQEWFDCWQARRQREKADSAQRLKDACPALATLGITNIVWSYDGYGDSGDIQNVEIKGSGNEPKSIEDLKAAFKGFDPDTQAKLEWSKLENAVWQLMPDGFENNSGGYGEVDVDAVNSRVQVRHNQRIEEVEYEEDNY